MSSTKISFSLNRDEGLEALQQAAHVAGSRSESLHAKQIVMSHVGRCDAENELTQQLDDLFREVVTLRRQTETVRQTVDSCIKHMARQFASAASKAAATESVTRDDLRNALFLVLLKQRPSSKEEAVAIADRAIPRTSNTSAF